VCRDAARLDRRRVLPGSIGWNTATILVCLPAAFCTRNTLSPKFQVLDCNSAMSRSRQSLAGSLIADFMVVGYFHFKTAGARAYLEHSLTNSGGRKESGVKTERAILRPDQTNAR
jgi:hypothetical protein